MYWALQHIKQGRGRAVGCCPLVAYQHWPINAINRSQEARMLSIPRNGFELVATRGFALGERDVGTGGPTSPQASQVQDGCEDHIDHQWKPPSDDWPPGLPWVVYQRL